jgi:lysozyme family protein
MSDTADRGFNIAFDKLMEHEGGFVDDPQDRGGATKYGISLRYLKSRKDVVDYDGDGDVDKDDICKMNKMDAKVIYYNDWWRKYGYYKVNSQNLSAKIFDLSVNMGPKNPHKFAQKACNLISGSSLSVDGIFGQKTIDALNNLEQDSIRKVLHLICLYAIEFYLNITITSEESFSKNSRFVNGWINRSFSLV